VQPLTAPPREHLTEQQVKDLITGDEVTIEAGLELLDSRNRYVDDISADLAGAVFYAGRDTVRGSARCRSSDHWRGGGTGSGST